MDKTRAWEEIESRWQEIQKLWQENFDVNNERIIIKLNKNIPKLSREKKKKRVKSQDFEIRFSDKCGNQVLSTKDSNASELLRRFVSIVGPERVKSSNVLTKAGNNLVMSIAQGKFEIFTKTANSEKRDAIRQIISDLEIDAEIVDLK